MKLNRNDNSNILVKDTPPSYNKKRSPLRNEILDHINLNNL